MNNLAAMEKGLEKAFAAIGYGRRVTRGGIALLAICTLGYVVPLPRSIAQIKFLELIHKSLLWVPGLFVTSVICAMAFRAAAPVDKKSPLQTFVTVTFAVFIGMALKHCLAPDRQSATPPTLTLETSAIFALVMTYELLTFFRAHFSSVYLDIEHDGICIVLPPGTLIRQWIKFFYSRKTVEAVFEPVLADLQAEWLDAITHARRWQARWVRFRGYWHLVQHIGLYSFVRSLRSMWTALKP